VPWDLLHQSVIGTAHLKDGRPCQDHSYGLVTRSAKDDILVVACADGAGSASHSDLGARIACETIVQCVCERLDAGFPLSKLSADEITKGFQSVRARIEREAAHLDIPSRELACTLLLVVAGTVDTICAQVGDGAIVIRNGDAFETAFWTDGEEELNLTHFVTEAQMERHLQFKRTIATDDVALMTDGLQLLALDFGTRSAHPGFFHPMFKAMRAAESCADLVVPFRSFLDSPDVNSRTDDDKTLVLAMRR